MSKPLELWLSNKLGRYVRLESTETANLLFDGKIFSELLASYGIPMEKDFKKSENFHEALASLSALNETLRMVGLEQEEETLEKIAHRDQLQAVKLLIKIYIHLEKGWPHSRVSVLGEPSYTKSSSSEDTYGQISPKSPLQSHGVEDFSDGVSRAMQVLKDDTVAACREEMSAHLSSLRIKKKNETSN